MKTIIAGSREISDMHSLAEKRTMYNKRELLTPGIMRVFSEVLSRQPKEFWEELWKLAGEDKYNALLTKAFDDVADRFKKGM